MEGLLDSVHMETFFLIGQLQGKRLSCLVSKTVGEL